MNAQRSSVDCELTWRRASDQSVLAEQLGDGLACFSTVSGETHILDAFPAEVFNRLPQDGPGITPRALAADIARAFDDQPDVWHREVVTALEQMARIALVEPFGQ